MIAPLVLIAAMTSADAPALRCEATRDLWVSGVGAEVDGNNGGAGKLKLKSYQEFSLIDLDPGPLRGRVIRKATLHLRSTGDPSLLRVTVGGIASEWSEGAGSNYEKADGASTFRLRKHPSEPWTADGGDITRVILANGGTSWGMADASPPDPDGWQTIAVSPRVVADRVAGISHGFLLFDDTGSEFARSGERFERRNFPNRFVFSREAGRAKAPYWTIELGDEDRDPPGAPIELRTEPGTLPAGSVCLSWITPDDRGGSGTVGFEAKAGQGAIPRDRIPHANRPGERVRAKLDGLNTAGGVTIAVRAVDGAGNVGPPAEIRIQAPSFTPARLLDPVAFRPPTKPAPLPRLGSAEVAVIDELDKVQPVTGAMVPPHPDGYLSANRLWDAASREVRLNAARGEFVAFQVVIRGAASEITARVKFDPEPDVPRAQLGVYWPVNSPIGPMPDPIVPTQGRLIGPHPWPGKKSSSLHVELYIPRNLPPGLRRGRLILESREGVLVLPILLTVWDFTLPDTLGFLPEMNAYGLPADERAYYRLAHEHRTVLNRLPYSQGGQVHDGCAPKWDGKALDWANWDRRFGPYLDGSAFDDLPRAGVPLECFYLPIHENWPTPIDPNYDGGYWADLAFKPSYRRDYVEVSRQFAEHFHRKRWGKTLFEGFHNNKVDFKAKGWSRGSSPWLLDEPAHFQDFWALHYFGSAFHEGVNLAGEGPAHLAFRCDVSRPQWQRDSLDDVLDVNVVGGAMRAYRPVVIERKERLGQIVIEYGGTNPVAESNLQPVTWCLDAWSLGMDGVLPWQTIGRDDSWDDADELSLFYPARKPGEGPTPSIRLKAYRRGQQDTEYLKLWASALGQPRWAVEQEVRRILKFQGKRVSSGGEDAGRIDDRGITTDDLAAFREAIGLTLSRLRPKPIEPPGFSTPKRTPENAPKKLVN